MIARAVDERQTLRSTLRPALAGLLPSREPQGGNQPEDGESPGRYQPIADWRPWDSNSASNAPFDSAKTSTLSV